MCKPSGMLVIIITAALAVLTGGASAGGSPNTNLPFSDTFEEYVEGTPLIDGTNGWFGSSSNIVVQTNIVRTGTNAAVIPVDCTLSNRFQDIPVTNIWIQMDVRPMLYDGTNNPVVDTNQAGMFYINTSGYFVVHNGTASDPTNSTNWVILTNGGVDTNEPAWVQVGVFIDFSQATWDLIADGILLSNNIGFINTNLTNFEELNIYNGAVTSYLDNFSVQGFGDDQRPLFVDPSAVAASTFEAIPPNVYTVQVRNVWSAPIGFEIATNAEWLAVAPTNGTVAGGKTTDVTITFDNNVVTNWPANFITNALLTLVATNGTDRWGTQTVAVSMTILGLQVRPLGLTNAVVLGETPTNQTFDIVNGGLSDLIYDAMISNIYPWLSFSGLSDTNGTVTASSTNTLTLTYANTGGMRSGSTNAVVTITSGGIPQTLSVKLNLSAELQKTPAQLNTAVMQGGAAGTNFLLWTENNGIINYAVSANQSWIVLSHAAGSLTGQTANATNSIGITLTHTAGLTIGMHYGTVIVSAPGCADLPVNVALTVRPVPMLGVSPSLITNSVMEGEVLASQVLRVWNGSAYYGISYQAGTNRPWMSVAATNSYLAPLAANNLTLSYSLGSLAAAGDVPSNYSGTITVTATNADGSAAGGSPASIPVALVVNPRPHTALSLTNLSQTVLQGQDAQTQGFDVWNANGFYTLEYSLSKGTTPWLVLSPSSGTSTGEHDRIEVQYSTANLPAGVTNALIRIIGWAWDGVHTKSAVATQTVAVALSVIPFSTLMTDAEPEYSYNVRKGVQPPDTVFNIWSGGAIPGTMYFTVTPSSSGNWLSVLPSSGTSTGNLAAISAGVDPASMKPGVIYSGTVRIDASDADTGKPAYGSPYAFTIAVLLSEFKGFDFQGGLSGASDLVLYREANGAWEIKNLLSEYSTTQYLGGVGYQAVPGDYTGNGITDMGVYRPASGSWYAQQAGAGSAQIIEMQQWSGADYVGVPGDYDGDGITDPAVYLEQSGLWMILLSGSGYQQAAGVFGGPGFSALLAGDYDGDVKADPGVYNRASGLWALLFSTSGTVISGIFGGTGFVPVPNDYDADGITDPAVYATDSGYWYILPSGGSGLLIRQFGGTAMSATLAPAPGNYDGADGADLALYDTATWSWYIMTVDGVPLAWGYPMGRLGCVPVLP